MSRCLYDYCFNIPDPWSYRYDCILWSTCTFAGCGRDRLATKGCRNLSHEALETTVPKPGSAATRTVLHEIRHWTLARESNVRYSYVTLSVFIFLNYLSRIIVLDQHCDGMVSKNFQISHTTTKGSKCRKQLK